jgi:hypothetical protein
MLKKLPTLARPWALVFACAIALVASSCTTDKTPNGPDDPPAQQSTPNPTPPANNTNATASVTLEVRPNPVPFSGAPITDAASCAGSSNTWFYDQTFTETAGVAVHFTARTDAFDGRVTNNGTADVSVPAKGTATIKSRWCSAASVSHTAKTTWTGTDANGHTIVATGGDVQLRSR